MFGNFAIVEARHDWATDTVEYTAFSDLFEEIQEYCAAPEYSIEMDSSVPPRIFARKL